MRNALHRRDDSSWWLRTCGCTAAQAEDVYSRFGLAPEKEETEITKLEDSNALRANEEVSADVAGVPPSPTCDEAFAGTSPKSDANKEKAHGGSEEDSYGFEAEPDKPGSKVGSVFSFGPEAEKSPKREPEDDDDDGFEGSGEFPSPTGGDGAQPEAESPMMHQRVFSFSGDQDDGYGFEAEENDPNAVLSEPPELVAVAGSTEQSSQPSIQQEYSFGGT